MLRSFDRIATRTMVSIVTRMSSQHEICDVGFDNNRNEMFALLN